MDRKKVSIHTEYITLSDLLKRVGAVDTGGQAKLLIQDGQVQVNGAQEVRRGRKLYPGDLVTLPGAGAWQVAQRASPGRPPFGEGT